MILYSTDIIDAIREIYDIIYSIDIIDAIRDL